MTRPASGPPEPGDPPAAGPAPALTVSAVARRLGVAPATLRTWDRRYGLGPTGHAAGTHRRYTAADVARLAHMRRLTLDGVSPADAARAALREQPVPSPVTPLPVPEDRPARGGGGRVVALPRGSATARGLARAAMGLDAAECTRIVRESLRQHGVVPTWQELAVPVLVAIGERWEATGQGVEVEHLLSECLLTALRAVVAPSGTPVNARPVLLACADEEQHSLPVHVLAAALAERRVGSQVLGARVPGEALADAVRRSGPLAVFVWSQLPSTAVPALLAGLPALRPAPFLLAGGPGWRDVPLPGGVTEVSDLPEAVARLSDAAGAA